jgi:hypothetical protein
LHCKTKNIVAKFTEVKTGWSHLRQVWQNIPKKVMDQKGLFSDDGDDYKRLSYYFMFASTCIKEEVLGRTNHLRVLSESESELLYDWPFTANQFLLTTSPERLTTSNCIFQLNTCGYSPYVTSSLPRGRVCLLVLASAVILRFQFRGTQDQILFSDSRLPQPGGPGLRIYIPQEQGGPIIPPGTGFPFRRLRLAGLRWRYSTPPPQGIRHLPPSTLFSLHIEYLIRHGQHRKHRVQQFIYCCVCIRCRGKVFTEPLPSNNRGLTQTAR